MSLKKTQASFQENLTVLDKRLTEVECKTVAIEEVQEEIQRFRQSISHISSENDQLRARQSELEDMQRRDNLLFYGLPDAQSESWAQTEEKLMNVFSSRLEIAPSEILIERAHRLGGYHPNKCRPVIAKFSSFKLKQQILLSSSKLKEVNVAVSEDYSPATRLARKKLAEFGKTQSSRFKLRFNKLYVNRKCYIYNPSDDCVREISESFKSSVKTSHLSHESPHASVHNTE